MGNSHREVDCRSKTASGVTQANRGGGCVSTGKHILLRKLEPVAKDAPPVAKQALKKTSLHGVNLDEPAFAPLDDAGAA